MQSKNVVTVTPRAARRRFSAQYKRELVEQALRPDVSLAAVALANGVNANQLSRWRRLHLQVPAAATLVPVQVVDAAQSAQSMPVTKPDGEVQWQHGATCLTIRGKVDVAILRTIISQTPAAGSK
ncbi:IS66-like element accessory protein TnpA [Pandoraea sputorum]|uniref:Transposase n=1 Tax=Pandoraea sputorum TaxID=93222 RepID=A0A5E5BGT7_9BURK|nr:transposase [Pandoraea sputorum]VVE84477.1 transposase [Pandoraea sputorum]